MTDIWALVHAERSSLAEDLSGLPAARWATPSLCPGWDVHDVLAHLVDDAMTTRLGFARAMLRARFDFDRLNAEGLRRQRRDEPADTLAAFRAARDRTTSAPAPRPTRLVEICVHGEDVRRPLGLDHDYAAEAIEGALRFQLRSSVRTGGGKERAAGLRLVAADLGLVHGDGPEVRGTGLALLLAVSGRPLRPGELAGEGASLLG